CEGCNLTFRVGCEEACTCGVFENISFGASSETAVDLACNAQPIVLDCPDVEDTIYKLIGRTRCNGDCRMSDLQWNLLKDRDLIASGDLNNTLLGFNFDIPTDLFHTAGVYTIIVAGSCGEESCRCRLRFVISEDCESDICSCGQFNNLQLIEGNASTLNLSCDAQIVYDLKCPASDRILAFDYTCPDSDCPSGSSLTWELTHLASNDKSSGFVNLNTNNENGLPNNLIPLSDSLFQALGQYRLNLMTTCGETACICTIEFDNSCEESCNCSNLASDWLHESAGQSDWVSEDGLPDWDNWISNCQLHLAPNRMKSCDQFSWRLIDRTNDDRMQRRTSAGKEAVVFDLVNGATYELQVTITRLTDDNGICNLTYTATRTIFCGEQQDFACSDIVLQNGSFAQGMNDWTSGQNAPETIRNTAGSDGNGYLLFSGSSNYSTSIRQTIDLDENIADFFLLRLDFNINQRLPESSIVLIATHPENNQTQIYGRIELDDDMALNEWLSSNTFVLPARSSNIAIQVESSYPDAGTAATRTQVGIDNVQLLPLINTLPTNDPVLYLDELGQAAISSTQVLQTGVLPCLFPNLQLSQDRFTCENIGVNEVTLTAVDASGSSVASNFMLTVLDTIAPTISCPDDIEIIQCASNTPITFAAPLVLDNCQNDFSLSLVNGLESGSIFPAGTTVQSYQVEDRSGNQATCSFTVDVEVFATEVLGESPSCNSFEDGSARVEITGGSGMAFYTWSNGANTAEVDGLAAGEYTVTIIDGNGCRTVDSVDIAAPPVFFFDSIRVQSPTGLTGQGSIAASLAGGVPPYDLRLMQDTIIIANSGSPFDSLAVGTYRLIATDAIGCTIVSEAIDLRLSTTTTDLDIAQYLQLYPNPTTGILHLKMDFPSIKGYQIDLFDLRGQRLQAFSSDRPQALNQKLDLSAYPAGIYFLKVQVGNAFVVERVVVME
ncbi:MAG: HYR domain-containing protein, partial [Bacteroidota bacterium]